MSQICSLTTVSEVESSTRFVTNDAPIVEAVAGLNVLRRKRSTSAVFPTPGRKGQYSMLFELHTALKVCMVAGLGYLYGMPTVREDENIPCAPSTTIFASSEELMTHQQVSLNLHDMVRMWERKKKSRYA